MYAHKYIIKYGVRLGWWSVENGNGCGVSKLSASSIYVVARTMMNRVFFCKIEKKYVSLCKIMFVKYVIDLAGSCLFRYNFYLWNICSSFICIGFVQEGACNVSETFVRFIVEVFHNISNKQIITTQFQVSYSQSFRFFFLSLNLSFLYLVT